MLFEQALGFTKTETVIVSLLCSNQPHVPGSDFHKSLPAGNVNKHSQKSLVVPTSKSIRNSLSYTKIAQADPRISSGEIRNCSGHSWQEGEELAESCTYIEADIHEFSASGSRWSPVEQIEADGSEEHAINEGSSSPGEIQGSRMARSDLLLRCAAAATAVAVSLTVGDESLAAPTAPWMPTAMGDISEQAATWQPLIAQKQADQQASLQFCQAPPVGTADSSLTRLPAGTQPLAAAAELSGRGELRLDPTSSAGASPAYGLARSEAADQMLPPARASLESELRDNRPQEPILDLTRTLRKGCGGPECVAMLLRPSAALEATFLVALIATGLVARRRREVAEQLEELIQTGEEQRRRSEEAVQRLKRELQAQESVLLDVLQGRTPGISRSKGPKSKPLQPSPGGTWLAEERVLSPEPIPQEASTSGRAPGGLPGSRQAVGGKGSMGSSRWRGSKRQTGSASTESLPFSSSKLGQEQDTDSRSTGLVHKQPGQDGFGGLSRPRRKEAAMLNLALDRPGSGLGEGLGAGKGWIQSQSQTLGGTLGQLDSPGATSLPHAGLEVRGPELPGKAEKVGPREGASGQSLAVFSRLAPDLHTTVLSHQAVLPPSSPPVALPPQRRPFPPPRHLANQGPPTGRHPANGGIHGRGYVSNDSHGGQSSERGQVAERSFCVVPDTNCYLRHFRLIRLLRKLPHVQTIVPLAVLGELDGLQQNSDPKTSFAARKAVRYFAQEIAAGAGWLRGQRQTEINSVRASESSSPPRQGAKFHGSQPPGVTTSEALKQWRRAEASQGRSPRPADDAIIDCCLYFSAEGKRVVLLTEDKALQVKAMFHKVDAGSLTQFLRENSPPEYMKHLQ